MIRYGLAKDKDTLMRLWKYCFPKDSERFVRFYFDNVYANKETLLFEENETIVSSLQIIPYQIKTSDNLYRAGYISGAMTHPDYREKGFMKKLLLAAFKEMIKKKFDFSFLIPQEKGLIKMYEKFGYKLCEKNPNPPENMVIKTPRQWSLVQRNLFYELGVWMKTEPVFLNEHKGMIKRLNPNAEEITSLYMGMMLDK